MSVADVEMCEGEAEAPIVNRCNADGANLDTTAATLAELIRAVGYIAPVAPDAHVQEKEDALVNGWLAHEPVLGHEDGWAHVLATHKTAERHYLESAHPIETSQMGRARFLEMFEAGNRGVLWRRLGKQRWRRPSGRSLRATAGHVGVEMGAVVVRRRSG